MKILIFDTETTGLPNWHIKGPKWYKSWPYIVQLSWILYNIDDNTYKKGDYIIKLPLKVTIPEESIKIHGITNEIMNTKGVNFMKALSSFLIHLQEADFIIAHNLDFDKKMMLAEFERRNMVNHFNLIKGIDYCTMRNSEKLCGLTKINPVSGLRRSKFPRLYELHYFLFKEILINLHNSYNDVLACLRCYYKLIYDEDILTKNKALRKEFRKITPV